MKSVSLPVTTTPNNYNHNIPMRRVGKIDTHVLFSSWLLQTTSIFPLHFHLSVKTRTTCNYSAFSKLLDWYERHVVGIGLLRLLEFPFRFFALFFFPLFLLLFPFLLLDFIVDNWPGITLKPQRGCTKARVR